MLGCSGLPSTNVDMAPRHWDWLQALISVLHVHYREWLGRVGDQATGWRWCSCLMAGLRWQHTADGPTMRACARTPGS